MNLKIASAKSMRNLSERNKPAVLQKELNKIQKEIDIAATKAETEICLFYRPCDEIINTLVAAGYQIDTRKYITDTIIKW